MFRCFVLLLLFRLSCLAQTSAPAVAESLQFELAPSGHLPSGWNGGPAETLWTDTEVFHGGKQALRIERGPDRADVFSAVNKMFPIKFTGKRLELRGFLRTENVTGFAGLWIREDGEKQGLEFDNMYAQHLSGTTGWKEYSITLPVNPDATEVILGVLLNGTGKAWADDLQLLVDGKPIWDVPVPKTVQDIDQEFESGSKSSFQELTKIQIENLVTLGKVWGFLKYHHPQVTSGSAQWDFELFRVLPNVLGAKDTDAANATISTWVKKLGPVPPCSQCASLPDGLYLRPELSWLSDERRLGKELSQALQSIYQNRATGAKQFYVSFVRGVGNPIFEHELTYQSIPSTDAGFRLLGVYRFWNSVEFWFPYRDVMKEDWDKVLLETIPKVISAQSLSDLQREMIALVARIHDTHANLWSSLVARPPVGPCQVPVNTRFIEQKAIVTSLHANAKDGELKVGDEIESIDGVSVPSLVREWTPYYAVSNEAAKIRDMATNLTKGVCGEVSLSVHRPGENIVVKTMRAQVNRTEVQRTHDLPGTTFRLLSGDVAYLKLSSGKIAEVPGYIESAANTKGMIIDIRNYPSEFMVFSLGQLLVDRSTPFVKFTAADASNPGAFHWTLPIILKPAQPHYSGKIVILIDEISQSQAEYTTMALRTAPGAVVLGSMTAGADGNVSAIPLVFGMRTMMSGIGVFYPDGRPTQRVGIIPDREMKPTVEGVRAGRDEVLEAGIREILGASATSTTIEKMARH